MWWNVDRSRPSSKRLYKVDTIRRSLSNCSCKVSFLILLLDADLSPRSIKNDEEKQLRALSKTGKIRDTKQNSVINSVFKRFPRLHWSSIFGVLQAELFLLSVSVYCKLSCSEVRNLGVGLFRCFDFQGLRGSTYTEDRRLSLNSSF